MTVTELVVTTPLGPLGVIDYGGSGRAVLFAHSPGFSARQWDRVAAVLPPDLHPVSFDLRGHGRSAGTTARGPALWRDIPAVISALGLDRPVVVAHDILGPAALWSARGGMVGGLVLINGSCAIGAGAMADSLGLIASDDFESDLHARFHLGSVVTEEEYDGFLARLASMMAKDWLAPMETQFQRDELAYQ